MVAPMLVTTNPGSNLKPMIEYTLIMDCFGITSLGLYLYKPLCFYSRREKLISNFMKPWVLKVNHLSSNLNLKDILTIS